MFYLFSATLLVLLLGLALLWLGRRSRMQSGLPVGEVVYSDTGLWEELEKPLISLRYGLVGRPDYLVKTSKGRRHYMIPVEVKSRKRPRTLYDSHLLQLATYCLLVEDRFKQRPPYGLLHYADATLQIEFTNELRRRVLKAADEIRRARGMTQVHRQHNEPGRCMGCGYQQGCGNEVLRRD